MTNKPKQILTDWTINFIKNKDAILNTLEKIEKNKQGFELKAIYENKEEFIIIEAFIKDFDKLIERLDKDKYISIILFNNIENLNIIEENWNRFIDFEKLTIYFVNMFSTTDRKWIIKPHFHNKIIGERSLRSGLKSMFNMVEQITKKQIESKNL